MATIQIKPTKVNGSAARVNKNPNAAVVKDAKKLAKDLTKANLVRPSTVQIQPKVVKTASNKNVLVQPIAKCAMAYAVGLPNPWIDKEICLPCDFYPLASLKNYAYSRGVMVIGTDGYGFALIKPGAANNLASISCTSVTSAGGANTALSAFSNTQTYLQSNNPFDSTAFMNGNVSSRFTAYGIKIQYQGKLMDRNGISYIFEEPDNQSIEGWTPAELQSANFTRQSAVTEKQFAVCHSGPTDPSDLEFRSGSNGIWPRGQAYTMGILVVGVPGDKYMVDAAFRCEYLGNTVSGKTMTHPVGPQFGAAAAAHKTQLLETGPLKPSDSPSIFQKFKDFISDNGQFLWNGAQAIGKGVAAVVSRNPALAASALESVGNMFLPAPTAQLRLTDTQRMILHANREKHTTSATTYFEWSDPYLFQYYDFKYVARVYTDIGGDYKAFHVPLIKPETVTQINRLDVEMDFDDSTWPWWAQWNALVNETLIQGRSTQEGSTPFTFDFSPFQLTQTDWESMSESFQEYIDAFLGQTPPVIISKTAKSGSKPPLSEDFKEPESPLESRVYGDPFSKDPVERAKARGFIIENKIFPCRYYLLNEHVEAVLKKFGQQIGTDARLLFELYDSYVALMNDRA